jgi:glycosyltransferase involved in cell wall biosynthesis
MTDAPGDVLLVHPGKQHSYEVAIALQQANRLLRFVTGIYDTPASWFARTARSIAPIAGRHRVERLLSRRRHASLDPSLITTWPTAELLSRTVGQTRLVRSATGGRSGYLFSNWSCDRALARALRNRRWRPRVVYAFLGAAGQTFKACRELGIRTVLDVPIILSARQTVNDERRRLGLHAGIPTITDDRLRLELEGADQILVPSTAVEESVRAAAFRGQLSLVPFGADVDCFRPGTSSHDGFRAVYAGRLEARKGLHHLLRAWHDAKVSGELVLAGSVGEPDFAKRIRQQYGTRVREAGNLTQRELAGLFATADVFVMPSLAEGSAFVTYEALAAGLPSLVTHETGSVVRDGLEGFVVPAGNVVALAERLRELHDNPALRRRMAAAAYARSRDFSWTAYHRRLVEAIESGMPSRSAIA